EWLTDGTLERIINEEIFSTKADKEEMEKELLNHLIQLNRLNRIKLGGGVSVKLSDLDEEVINFLTDGGTVTIEGTPSDYSVTPIKTTFLYVSENIFDPEKMKDGYTVNDQGEMVESLNFSTSEFIPVNRNSIYSSNGVLRIIRYDQDFNHINSYSPTDLNDAQWSTESGTEYVRFITHYGNYRNNKTRVNEGETLLGYEPYGVFLDPKIKITYPEDLKAIPYDHSVSIEKTD